MKSLRPIVPAITAALFLAAALAAQPVPSPASAKAKNAQEVFESLKKLAGTWEGVTEGMEGKSEIRYRVISAGSVLLETIFPGSDHEMATVYYMEGPELVLVHYCAARNQPHMRFAGLTDKGEYRFDFAGGTNLDPAKDAHMHNFRIRFDGPDKAYTEWDYFKEGKKTETMKFALSRKP